MGESNLRPEWKDEYLSALKGGQKTNVNQVFGVVKKYEDEIGKDVSLMTTDELIRMIRRMCEYSYQSYDSRRALLLRLRVYANWLVDSGKISENLIVKIKESDLSDVVRVALKRSMLGGPRDLSQILSVLNFKDFPNRSSRASIIARLLFAGLLSDEIAALNKNDMDYERGVIMSKKVRDGREVVKYVKADDEIKRLWDLCANMEWTETVSMYNTPVVLPLRTSVFLIGPTVRNPELEKYKTNAIMGLVGELFAEYDERRTLGGRDLPPRKISAMYLWKSGIFYRAWHEEQLGELIDNHYLYKIMGEPEGLNWRSFSSRNIAKDYTAWKGAFGRK
jgi:hypothetical protein